MPHDQPVAIRMFGLLHTWRRARGLPAEISVWVPPEGRSGLEIARDLGLPVERIESVFCNHVARDLDHVVRPGDALAFVPQGTPGPHRFLLGIHRGRRKASKTESPAGG